MYSSLPIDSIKSDFLAALSQQHIVVEAETGSGKSTRLPLWAAELGRVLVVEPRRVACTSLAEYLTTKAANPSLISVGYAIRFEQHFDASTQVVFATPGVALRWLSDDQLAHFDTVIIDEFHERRWDTDLLLALLKQRQSHRLVATSATMDSQRLVEYLEATHLHAAGRNFMVDVYYHANDNQTMPSGDHLEQRIVKLVSQHYDTHQDILVFLPGRKEITAVTQALRRYFTDAVAADEMDVIPLHASVTDDERQRALTASEKQRIILATNVAETSLTIPGVTLIIDSGLERRTHQRNGRTVLLLHAISNASAEQRKGRAGRVKDGVCIRLYGKAAPLERLTPAELQREELVEPYLAALCCDAQFSQLSFIDSLPEKTLASAFQALQAMNAVTEDEVVTDYGRRLYQLPIDSLFAHLITAMPDRRHQEAMVDLAAALSIPQKLWQPPKSEQDQHALWLWLGQQYCDATALIKIVRADVVPEWLTVDDNMRVEARLLAAKMREVLQLPQLEVASAFRRQSWIEAVMAAVPELVYVRRERRRQALGNGFNEVTLSRDTLFGIEHDQSTEAAVVFDKFALPGKGIKQNIVLATCVAPVTLSQMVALDLGDKQQGQTVEAGAGHFQTAIERVYAGRVIDTQWQDVSGEAAGVAIVDLILANEVLEGLAARLSIDIKQWNLYLGLGRYQADICQREPEVIDLALWLSQQIADLGIETIDDIALFSAEDFIFEGIPDWEREEFDNQYPHSVNLNDFEMRIEYQISRKTVIAHYQQGNRKQDPKRWELPRWQGWRIKYKKASRTIDIH
ncbi:DEAD/DEAH box helicase [Photobacterium kishitanii]|uniref:ATP-dependent RNA helicase n=1 Tax=Photobacterium kishitanii TaxID=318456 RepID=A0AAX0YWE7_9GAMM|nr:helicase-related protein [Photobacterium kishitanii]KJG58948.1 DEAD/DEAH box helicase [Photobacterium kishitanii]KJG62123.1 DEAD/DEAH box helicase [Photobacterium kishitanii]KJG67147.1 DEAD/DEAH box helicase [Photobacterium kishitanii]KJG70608.1 DEAD/DEAH box helicase [Photobacterium kishitanii]PSX20865.1 ATP-dependent RNA helicase [Photobacterium kishitanii]